MRSRRGFSLVSTLVVFAVLAVLMAILLPSLAAAKRQAKRTSCAVNLRNIGAAMISYRMDYSMSLPLSYMGAEPLVRPKGKDKDISISADILFSNAAWRDHGWPGLPGLLETYLQKQSGAFTCPATPSVNPVPLYWTGQARPQAGDPDDPEATGSYDYYAGASFYNDNSPGKGNKTFFYPDSPPPKPYPGTEFSSKGIALDPTMVLAMDRFYEDDRTSKKKGASGTYYSNHTNGAAKWIADSFTYPEYRAGIYSAPSTSSFNGIHVLRLDGSVTAIQSKDFGAIMIKAPGLGNGQIIYGPFPQ